MVESVLSFVVGLVASITSVTIFHIYFKRRRVHHLLWAIGLLLWAVSDFAQGYALVQGWVVPLYKLYYFSAISLTGFLGAATMGLILSGRRVFPIFSVCIILLIAILSFAITFAAVDEDLLKTAVVGGLALPSNVRLFAPLINIPGGIAFIGGAAYSFVKSRKLYALLITLGALSPAIGGTLARFEIPVLLPFTDFLGIILLSTGIYLSFKTAIRRDSVTRV